MKTDFKVGISGPDNKLLYNEVFNKFFQQAGNPAESFADDKPFKFNRETLNAKLQSYKREVFLRWDNLGYLTTINDSIVLFGLNEYEVNPVDVLKILETFSFEIASFSSLHHQWLNPVEPYAAPSFSNFHLPHGWACAFKGNGFKRLVSLQWLDYGPWKQHIGNSNTQLFQFHEMNVDARTALQQATTGHKLMGISDEGGFIQSDYVYKYNNPGLYESENELLKVIVHGLMITKRQMLDACALKLYQGLGKDKPLKNVRYIFMTEEEATHHLHDLWLRNLQCYAIIKGKEIRLDDQYHPETKKPEWTINSVDY